MLIQPLAAAFLALTVFLDGAVAFKSKIGNTARRNQQRAAKIVQDSQAAHQLHARQANGTGNTTTPLRFLSKATERKDYHVVSKKSTEVFLTRFSISCEVVARGQL